MKLFLLAFVALAAAEPESFYPYTSSGMVIPSMYNYGINNYGINPYGVRTYAAGNPVVKSGTFHTNLQNVLEGKKPAVAGTVYQPIQRFAREAESESFYPYSSLSYNPMGYSNLGYNNMYYSSGVVPTVNYLNSRSYFPYVKREAESESDSFYPGYPYSTYNYNTFSGVRNVIPTTTYNRYSVPVASSIIPSYNRYYNYGF